MTKKWRLALGSVLLMLGLLVPCGTLFGKEKAPEKPKELAEPSWTNNPVSRFMFYAVLDGLYADGVSNAVVDSIIPHKAGSNKRDYTWQFVYTCPLCQPALEAFRVYRNRPAFLGFPPPAPDTIGDGVDETTKEQLNSPALSERQKAMERLIEKWVRRRLDLMRLTDSEKADWAAKLEVARVTGMGLLKSFQDNKTFGGSYQDWTRCPVCDGAVAACNPSK